jgi:hypothetical protein
MKIKIIKVEQPYPPKQMDKGGTCFAYGCKIVNESGAEAWARVQTFTDKIKIEAAAEFETGKNCENIKVFDWDANGKKMKCYSIFALKQNNFKKFEPRKQKTKAEYLNLIMFAYKTAGQIYCWTELDIDKLEKEKLKWSYFSAILKGGEYVNFGEKENEKE